jgi:hypothetical protein
MDVLVLPEVLPYCPPYCPDELLEKLRLGPPKLVALRIDALNPNWAVLVGLTPGAYISPLSVIVY